MQTFRNSQHIVTCYRKLPFKEKKKKKGKSNKYLMIIKSTASYLRRTTHHQLYEVPATSFGCLDISYMVQSLQSTVFRQAAGQHGPLWPFRHPACPSSLLVMRSSGLGLVEIWHPKNWSWLSPPSISQLHFTPSTRGRNSCAGLALGWGCRFLIPICLFVIVQWKVDPCKTINCFVCSFNIMQTFDHMLQNLTGCCCFFSHWCH